MPSTPYTRSCATLHASSILPAMLIMGCALVLGCRSAVIQEIPVSSPHELETAAPSEVAVPEFEETATDDEAESSDDGILAPSDWLIGEDGSTPDSTPGYRYVETELLYRGELYWRGRMTLADSKDRRSRVDVVILPDVLNLSPGGTGLVGFSRFRVLLPLLPPKGFMPGSLECCHPRDDVGIEKLEFRWNGCLWELQSGSN